MKYIEQAFVLKLAHQSPQRGAWAIPYCPADSFARWRKQKYSSSATFCISYQKCCAKPSKHAETVSELKKRHCGCFEFDPNSQSKVEQQQPKHGLKKGAFITDRTSLNKCLRFCTRRVCHPIGNQLGVKWARWHCHWAGRARQSLRGSSDKCNRALDSSL